MLAWALSGSAHAETTPRLPAEITFAVGELNPLQHDSEQFMGLIEYRFAELKWNVRPWVALARAEKGTTFASAGLRVSFDLTRSWRFSAGWAPTYYDAVNGRDLGAELEFYSYAEFGRVFENAHVLSVRIGHLSNGGLAVRNPGTETLLVSYSLPVGRKR